MPAQSSPGRRLLPEAAVFAVFLVVAGAWAGLGWTPGVERLNSDQQNILLMVAKDLNPDLYRHDPLFSQPAHYAFYTPLFRHYLARMAALTGDPAAGYRLLVFPVNLLFLTGAYLCCRRLFAPRVLAAGLALAAALPFAVPAGAEMSGVGPLTQMLPRTLFTAAFPWLLWGYYRYRDHPGRLALVLFATGAAANLHPVSGLLLVEVLLLGLVLTRPGAGSTWKAVLLGGLAALAGAAPCLWTYVGHGPAVLTQMDPELWADILRFRFAHNLYPPLNLASWPTWSVHLFTAVVLLAGAAALTRGPAVRPAALWGAMLLALGYLLYPEARFYLFFLLAVWLLFAAELPADPDFELTAVLTIATFAVALGGAVILQSGGLWQVFPGLAINQTRAARFAPFLMFLGVGYAATVVFRTRRRRWAKALVLVLLVVAVGAQLRLTYRSHIHWRPDPARQSLVEMARWAREHTDPDDVFLFDSLAFRLLAGRALTGCAKDGGLWFFAPQGLVAWYERQRELPKGGRDPLIIPELARRWDARYFVVPRSACEIPPGFPVVYENAHYVVLRRD